MILLVLMHKTIAGASHGVSNLSFRLTQGELIEMRIETRAIVVKRGEELNGKRVWQRHVEDDKKGTETREMCVKREHLLREESKRVPYL